MPHIKLQELKGQEKQAELYFLKCSQQRHKILSCNRQYSELVFSEVQPPAGYKRSIHLTMETAEMVGEQAGRGISKGGGQVLKTVKGTLQVASRLHTIGKSSSSSIERQRGWGGGRGFRS